MKVVSSPPPGVDALRQPAAPQPPNPSSGEPVSPSAPTDSVQLTPSAPGPQETRGVLSIAGDNALKSGVNTGNVIGAIAGGVGAFTLMTGALYAGALGGAVAGSAFGLGFGPVVATLGSSGAREFLSQTFTTAGFAAHAGVIIGSVAMGAGAFKVGHALGNVVGKPVGLLIGTGTGFAQGVWKGVEAKAGSAVDEQPAPIAKKPRVRKESVTFEEMNGLAKVMVGVAGSGGAIAGAVGGSVLVGSVATAANLVQGLMAHNVTMAALTGAAGVGAIAGGAAGAILGGYGGWQVAKGTHVASEYLKHKLIRSDDSTARADRNPANGELTESGKAAAHNLLNFTQDLSAARLGLNVADAGATAAAIFSRNSVIGPMNIVLGAGHTLLAIGNLFGCDGQSSKVVRHRLTMAAGEGLAAAGQFVASSGAGAWSVPLVGAGLLLNTVEDYRYNKERQ